MGAGGGQRLAGVVDREGLAAAAAAEGDQRRDAAGERHRMGSHGPASYEASRTELAKWR
jgi:hypothetical protein